MSTPLLKKKHAEEPPIETGTSWMTKIGGVLGLPFSVFMGGGPFWIYLMAEKKEESGEFSFFIIGIIVLVILLFAAFGLLFLCASIQALVMRIRVDEEGVHVRLFTWRHYSWEKITPKNIMPLHTNRSRSNAFSPGDFTRDGIVRKPTGRDLVRTYMSRDSFLFEAIPIAAREKILQRIYAHFPPRTPLDLPDSLCFRTQGGLLKKRVTLDTHGITIKTWMVEKRYTWANVKRMVIHHISPFHSYYKGLHLDFNDGASLSLNELLPSRWLGPKPDPAVVMDFLARYVPQERRIEIIPGIPLTVKRWNGSYAMSYMKPGPISASFLRSQRLRCAAWALLSFGCSIGIIFHGRC